MAICTRVDLKFFLSSTHLVIQQIKGILKIEWHSHNLPDGQEHRVVAGYYLSVFLLCSSLCSQCHIKSIVHYMKHACPNVNHFSSIPNSSWCLPNSCWNFRLTDEPPMETYMIFDKLIISTDLLNSMSKSLLVMCVRNFESQYLNFSCWSWLSQYLNRTFIWQLCVVWFRLSSKLTTTHLALSILFLSCYLT